MKSVPHSSRTYETCSKSLRRLLDADDVRRARGAAGRPSPARCRPRRGSARCRRGSAGRGTRSRPARTSRTGPAAGRARSTASTTSAAGRAEALRLGGQLERLVHAARCRCRAGTGRGRRSPRRRRASPRSARRPSATSARRSSRRPRCRACPCSSCQSMSRRDRVEVERAVGVERRDERRDRAADRRVTAKPIGLLVSSPGARAPGLELRAALGASGKAADGLARLDALERPRLALLLLERVARDLLGQRRGQDERRPRRRRRSRRRA